MRRVVEGEGCVEVMMALVESVMKTYCELCSRQSKRSELDMNAAVNIESQLSMEKCNNVDSKSNEHQVQVIFGKSLGCILKRSCPKKAQPNTAED